MDGSLKKIQAWDSANEKWINIVVDENGYLKIADTGGLLKASDLNLDATKDLQVDVKTSGLPDGASTSANQTTMITALQLIDDLRAALGSVNTDDLQVDVKNYPADYPDSAANTKLTNILTELQQKLETADLSLDASKYLNVNVKSQTDIDRRIYGHNGSSWMKLPLLLGYTDFFSFFDSIGSADAGENSITSNDVPSNYLWILTNITALNNTSSCSSVAIYFDDDTYWYAVASIANPAAHQLVFCPNTLIMKANSRLRFIFNGCTAGDALEASALGYRMKINNP